MRKTVNRTEKVLRGLIIGVWFGFFALLGAQETEGINGVADLDRAQNDSPIVELAWNIQETQVESALGLERLMVIVAFVEGDPQVSFFDPSGAPVFLDSPKVSYTRQAWGLLASLLEPMPGKWRIRLENTLGPQSYTIKVMGVGARPAAELTTPSFQKEPASESVRISGKVAGVPEGQLVSLIFSEKKGSGVGPTVAEFSLPAGGAFDREVVLGALPDGEYFVTLKVELEDAPSVFAEAPGSIMLRHSQPLKAVENILSSGDEAGILKVTWTDPNGDRSTGYSLHLRKEDGSLESIPLGKLNSTKLEGFEPGSKVRFWVSVEDSAQGTSVSSAEQEVLFARPPQVVNPVVLAEEGGELEVLVGQTRSAYTFPLQGSFSTTGGASDYVFIEMTSPTTSLSFKPSKSHFHVSGGETSPGGTLEVSSQAVPGSYELTFDVVSLGQSSNRDRYTLRVRVKYPPLGLSSVEPPRWLLGSEPTLTIAGTSFLAGTRVFLDEEELSLVTLEPTKITVKMPGTLAKGYHSLRILGPGLDSLSKEVYVGNPSYTILGFKTVSQSLAGKSATFRIGVSGKDDFVRSSSFSLEGLPSGWTGSLSSPDLGPGEYLTVSLTSPENTLAGTYRVYFVDEEGSRLPLTVKIVDSPPAPFLSGLSANAEIPGRSVRLWGYGFGEERGSLKLGDLGLEPTSWSQEEVLFSVPEGARSGELRLTRADGALSNLTYFYVKDFGFKLYTPRNEYNLQGGDEIEVPVSITGYRELVNLRASTQSSYLSVSFEDPAVVPIGQTNLLVRLDKNIPLGTYTISLDGTSGVYQAGKDLKIVVGKAFSLTTPGVPAAREGSTYKTLFETENGSPKITFTLQEGKLPLGLEISAEGVLEGRAGEGGLFRFVVAARDGEGRLASKEYTLLVEESLWLGPEGDLGKTSFAALDGPAENKRLFTSEAQGEVLEASSGNGLIFQRTRQEIVAQNPNTGKGSFRIAGSFQKMLYTQGYLALVDAQGLLRLHETNLGYEVWRREGVKNLFPYNDDLVVETAEGLLFLEVATGQLIKIVEGTLEGELLFLAGKLYRLQDGVLQRWSEERGFEVFRSFEGKRIRKVALDPKAFLYVLSDGLAVLEEEGKPSRSWQVKPVEKLVLGGSWLAFAGPEGASVWSRDDLGLLSELPADHYRALIGSREKLFALQPGGLYAYNLYSGKRIWSLEGNFTQALLRSDKLYVNDSQGRLLGFNGSENLGPSVSTLVLDPPLPEGAEGWFLTNPQASLALEDKETRASESHWKIASEDKIPYTSPRLLSDGQYQIVFGSTDSHGWQEPEHIVNLKIDGKRPRTNWQISGTASPIASYYWSPVTVRFTVTEEGSGLEKTQYQLNGGSWFDYEDSSFTFNREGRYTLAVRSKDKAGGWEETQTRDFYLDFSNPTASIEVQERSGITFVYLYGRDGISPLERLEYRIDQGDVQVYTEALTFTSGGPWSLTYRAVDASGRGSEWKTERFQVRHDKDKKLIDNVVYYDRGRDREQVEDAKVGLRIFNRGSNAAFKNLPEDLKGTLYFRNLERDGLYKGPELFRFKAEADLYLYYVEDPRSQANLEGWELLRDLPPGFLSDSFFLQGAKLWRKFISDNTSVSIPGAGLPSPGGDLVFVGDPGFQGAEITSPQPGDSLYAGQKIFPKVYLPSPGTRPAWSYRLDQGGWQDLRLDPQGAFSLPRAKDGSRLTLRYQARLRNKDFEALGYWTIQNKEALTFLSPVDKAKIVLGAPFTPTVEVRDVPGSILSSETVTYKLYQGSRLLAQGSGPFTLNQQASYRLDAQASLPDGRKLEASVTLATIKSGSWVKLEFADDRDREWRPGAERGFLRKDTTVRDYDIRLGSGNKKEEIEALVWKQDQEYRLSLPDGTYGVRLLVGPERAWAVHTVVLGSSALNLMFREPERLYALRFVVNVSEGFLTLKATDKLPLFRLDYRLLPQAQAPSASVEGTLNSLE